MSKFATKAAANMFCQARYEAAKSNERLSSREGAAEEIGIDRTRLRIKELTIWHWGIYILMLSKHWMVKVSIAILVAWKAVVLMSVDRKVLYCLP